MESANPVYFILAVVFVAIVGLFGAALMFVRGENIERNYLVGGLTILTALVAGTMLVGLPPASQTSATLVSISLVSVVGFVVGRVIDAILGPRDHTDPATLGADLSD
jgi:hypothetical protein